LEIFEGLKTLVKEVGIPFAIVLYLLWRIDHYVDRFLNHFGTLNKVLGEMSSEVKNFKYYIHLQKPPNESNDPRHTK